MTPGGAHRPHPRPITARSLNPFWPYPRGGGGGGPTLIGAPATFKLAATAQRSREYGGSICHHMPTTSARTWRGSSPWPKASASPTPAYAPAISIAASGATEFGWHRSRLFIRKYALPDAYILLLESTDNVRFSPSHMAQIGHELAFSSVAHKGCLRIKIRSFAQLPARYRF